MSDEATRKGVSEEGQEQEEGQEEQAKPDSHFNKVEDMAEKWSEIQKRELKEALDADPAMKAHHEAMQADSEGEEEEESSEDDGDDEGLAHREEIEGDDAPAPAKEQEDDDDPLKEFIVYEKGKPMVSLKVDGETRLLPLEKARAELQKRESGDARLQRASEIHQTLEQRAQQLAQAERELAAKALKKQNPESLSGKADVDDAALEEQATKLVKTLFGGTEEEAAAEVKKILAGRASQQTSINVDEIVDKAAERAERRALEREQQKEAARKQREGQTAYKTFMEEFADIAADERLFRIADDMTTEIAQENPEMSVEEVMMEAGKRTREWWGAKPEQQEKAKANEEDLAERQKRKKQLRPMPRRATATQEKAPEERPDTPKDIVRQMREARHQAV